MKNNLTYLIKNFPQIRVLVIGEAILDSYLQGFSDRLCREAPVPIVSVAERQDAPGGAANTAVNIRSLGAQVTFLSVIGDDREGRLMQTALSVNGVTTEHLLIDPDRRTLTKHRVVATSQILLRFDEGTTDAINGPIEAQLVRRFKEEYRNHDAVIISDYNYGILTPRLIETARQCQSRTPRLLVVDARNLSAYRDVGVMAVKPNYAEALQLLGIKSCQMPVDRVNQIADHETELLELCGSQIAAVTLDTDGALIFECGRPPYRTYARPRPHSRATGAGDTYVAALALALAAGAYTPAASELASAAAAIVVGKDGTNACSMDELQACVGTDEKFIRDRSSLADRLELYRQRGHRIIFTNGCFDILHRGHITYLNQAKALGDILIVGLNSDAGVRRLKGPRRPINPLEDRAQVLAALSCVDHIVPFNEPTPRKLIRLVRPDIFVKGGDYTHETLPEAGLVKKLGGEVRILSYLEDISTTSIIDRIRAAYARPSNGRLTLETVLEQTG